MLSVPQPTIYDSHEVFDTYLKASTEKEEFIHRFARRFRPAHAPICLVDVGCNEGALTLGYLDAIKDKLPPASKIVCVEPNLSALNIFKAKSLPIGLDFEFVHQSAEEFCSERSTIVDWVIVSHSLYWSHTLETLLPKMVAMGQNVVIVIREKDRSFTFVEKFVRPEVNMCSGDTISEILRDNHVQFEREVIEHTLQIPPFNTHDYRLFLAFHLDTPLHQISEKLVLETSCELSDFNGVFPFNAGCYWITAER